MICIWILEDVKHFRTVVCARTNALRSLGGIAGIRCDPATFCCESVRPRCAFQETAVICQSIIPAEFMVFVTSRSFRNYCSLVWFCD